MQALIINQLVQYPVAFLFGFMLVVQIMYSTNETQLINWAILKFLMSKTIICDTYIIYLCTYIYIYRLVD